MKTDYTKETLLNCLDYSKQPELPPILGEDNSNWLLGIALVLRVSSEEDYVIVKNDVTSVSCIESYNLKQAMISEYKEIYPFEFYSLDVLPQFKTLNGLGNYLKDFYPISSLIDENNNFDKAKIKILTNKLAIKTTLEKKKNGGNVIRYAKPTSNKTEIDTKETSTKKTTK